MMFIFTNLYFFLERLEPQSSMYLFGLYGGCFLMSTVCFLGSMTTHKFPFCSAAASYAQCLCFLLYCASYDND